MSKLVQTEFKSLKECKIDVAISSKRFFKTGEILYDDRFERIVLCENNLKTKLI